MDAVDARHRDEKAPVRMPREGIGIEVRRSRRSRGEAFQGRRDPFKSVGEAGSPRIGLGECHGKWRSSRGGGGKVDRTASGGSRQTPITILWALRHRDRALCAGARRRSGAGKACGRVDRSGTGIGDDCLSVSSMEWFVMPAKVSIQRPRALRLCFNHCQAAAGLPGLTADQAQIKPGNDNKSKHLFVGVSQALTPGAAWEACRSAPRRLASKRHGRPAALQSGSRPV